MSGWINLVASRAKNFGLCPLFSLDFWCKIMIVGAISALCFVGNCFL